MSEYLKPLKLKVQFIPFLDGNFFERGQGPYRLENPECAIFKLIK